MKSYSYEKGGGGGKSLSHAEGGHNKFWGRFYMVVSKVLAILKGRKFPLFKGGGRCAIKSYPVLRGWGAKHFGFAIFPFCSPPPPRN